MKFKCKISGLEWQEDILDELSSSTLVTLHPIFSISESNLISLASAALADPNETSMYLVGLAAFNKLNPIWISTVNALAAAPMIVSQFERIIKLVFAIPKERRDQFPSYRIDSSNNDFAGLIHWLDAIQSVFDEWKQSGKELEFNRLLARKESVLITLLNNRYSKKPGSIASALAEWASIAAQFPKSCFYMPDGTTTTLDQYWKVLIKHAFVDDHLEFISLRVDPDDLEDLIDYCEMNIPHGTTQAHILLSKLRKSLSILNEFVRPKIKQPTLVDESEDIAGLLSESKPEFQQVNQAVIMSEPKAKDFKSTAEYLRAKLKWQVQTVSNRNSSLASEL